MHPRLQEVVKAYDVRGRSPEQLDAALARALGLGVRRRDRHQRRPRQGGRRPRHARVLTGDRRCDRGRASGGGAPAWSTSAWRRPTCSTARRVCSTAGRHGDGEPQPGGRQRPEDVPRRRPADRPRHRSGGDGRGGRTHAGGRLHPRRRVRRARRSSTSSTPTSRRCSTSHRFAVAGSRWPSTPATAWPVTPCPRCSTVCAPPASTSTWCRSTSSSTAPSRTTRPIRSTTRRSSTCRRRCASTTPTSGSPSTATPTGASSSTRPASVVSPSAITGLIATRHLAIEPGATILHNVITSRAVPEIVTERGGTADPHAGRPLAHQGRDGAHRRGVRRRALRPLLLP